MHEQWEKSVAARIKQVSESKIARSQPARCHKCDAPVLSPEQIQYLRLSLKPEESMWLTWCTCSSAYRPGTARAERERVYFIGDLSIGYVKVGYSQSLKLRLDSLQTGCPFPLKVLAVIRAPSRVESAIHRYLDEWRSIGEWFHASPTVLHLVELARSGVLERIVAEWLKDKQAERLDIQQMLMRAGHADGPARSLRERVARIRKTGYLRKTSMGSS